MMRRLAVPAAAVAAVLAFYVIAPTPSSSDENRGGVFWRNQYVSEASLTAWALVDTLRALTSAVQRAQALETARSLAADDAAIKVISMPGMASSTASRFEQAARAELEALARPRVPIRIVFAPDSLRGGFYRKHIVIPQNTEEPCVVVVAFSPRARNLDVARNDRLIGACGFYARFGYPGTGMRNWLVDTRGSGAEVDTILATQRQLSEPRRLKGSTIAEVPTEAACLAGDDEACALSVLNPLGNRATRTVIPTSERLSGVFISFASMNWYGPGQNLAELRAHVGDRRFEQIWTSSENPADAYKTATGEHIAVFARPILLREVLPHKPGPLRADLSLLFALTLGTVAATLAIKRSRRERSGN